MSLFSRPKRYLSCDFDIEFINAFAIERDIDAGCTIIGYWHQGPQEWHLPCTEAKHEELYQRYLKEKNRIRLAHGQPLIPSTTEKNAA